MEKADFENLLIWQIGMDFAEHCKSISEMVSKNQKGHF